MTQCADLTPISSIEMKALPMPYNLLQTNPSHIAHALIQFIAHRCIHFTALLALAIFAPMAGAQVYPSKPIRLVVPAVPGGSSDSISRMLAKVMSEQNGIQVIVDNRAGASGTIGSAYVANSPPDGYTFLLSDGTIALYPLMASNVPYTIEKDLIPVAQLVSTNFVFAVNPKLNVSSVKEFVTLAASRPGKLTYSTPGNGSLGHLVMETLKSKANVDLLHVPYKGAAPAMMGLISQDVDITVTSPASLRGFVESGKLKPIGFTGAKRSAILPDVPTMDEQGFSNFQLSAWWGIFLPSGVLPVVSEKLTSMILSALRAPEFQKHSGGLSLDIALVVGKAFSQSIIDQNRNWKELIDKSNVKLD